MAKPKSLGGQVLKIQSSQLFCRSPLTFRAKQFHSRFDFSTYTARLKSLPNNASNASSATTASTGSTLSSAASTPLAAWQRLGYLSTFFRFYSKSQTTRPYTTQFFSSLAIFCAGDLGAQYIGGETYDFKRTLRVLAISAGSSVAAFKWLLFVGRNFNYASKLLSLGTKVLVNQIVYAPIFGTYYFTMQSFLSGDSAAQVWDRVKKAVPVSVKSSWMFWPPITGLTFAFIPPTYQAVTLAGVATCWQTYLSYLNRKTDSITRTETLRTETAENA